MKDIFFAITFLTVIGAAFAAGWFISRDVERAEQPPATRFKMIEAVDVSAARVGDPKCKLRVVIETDDGRRLGESEWRDIKLLPKEKP